MDIHTALTWHPCECACQCIIYCMLATRFSYQHTWMTWCKRLFINRFVIAFSLQLLFLPQPFPLHYTSYEYVVCYPCIVYKLTSKVTLFSYHVPLAAFPTPNCKLMLRYYELNQMYYYYIIFPYHITGMLRIGKILSKIYLKISGN